MKQRFAETKWLDKLIFIFLVAQPVLDFLNSLAIRFLHMDLTVGMVVRILFVCFSGVYLLFFYDGKGRKILAGSFLTICGYGALFLAGTCLRDGFGVLFTNVKMFVKMYYFLFVLLFFIARYLKDRYLVKDRTLSIVFFAYAASIFLSAVTNTSFATYDYGEGFCGWFYAGNEIGAIICALAPIAFLYAMRAGKHIVYKVATFFLFAFASVYIGTKVPFGACLLTIVFFMILYLIFALRKKVKLAPLLQVLCVLLCMTVLLFAQSPLYKNTGFFAGENFEDHVINPPEETPEPGEDDPDDPNRIPSRNQLFLVANWLLSDRLVVAEPAFETFASASIYHQLFGLGYTFGTPRGTTFQALIEMDFFALLLNQGIVGLLLYIIPLALFAWFCLKNLFKPSATVEEQEDKVAYTLSVLLLIGCACLAGHVFTAPAVSIYLAISMVKLYGLLAK